MKKRITIMLLFLIILSSSFAFQGSSSNYSMNFNSNTISNNPNSTNYSLNLDSSISGVGKSQNYIMRFSSLKFNSTNYFTKPTINVSNLINNSNYNLSRLSIPLSATFSKGISKLEYQINNNSRVDITNEIILNSINTNIDLDRYQKNIIKFYFNDYYSNQNTFTITINATLNLNGTINDTDGDGINNTFDRVLGTKNNINNNLINLSLEINQSNNLSKIFNSTLNVTLKDQNKTIIEFVNNFSNNELDLANITIKLENITNQSRIFIRGLNLGENKTKTIYLTLTGNTTTHGSLCIKDQEIFSFDEISSACNSSNELYISSIPFSNLKYSVGYKNQTQNIVKITGLSHSGVSQTCTEDWTYSTWTSCSNSLQTRTATDNNNCGTLFTRDSLSQSCTMPSSSDPSSSSPSSSSPSSFSTPPITPPTITPPKKSTPIIITPETKNELIMPNKITSTNYEVNINNKKITETKFTKEEKIEIKSKKSNKSILEFNFDFSKYDLNLSTLNIKEGKENNSNYIIIRGLDLKGKTKSIRLDKTLDSNFICIKDAEVNSISEISNTCSNSNEYKIECNSQIQNGYTCTIENNQYLVSGLKHSGVKEYNEKINVITQNQTITENVQKDPKSNLILYLLSIPIIILIIIIFFVVKSKNKTTIIQSEFTNPQEQQLYNYIKKERENGYSDESIKQACIKTGWHEEIINKLMSK